MNYRCAQGNAAATLVPHNSFGASPAAGPRAWGRAERILVTSKCCPPAGRAALGAAPHLRPVVTPFAARRLTAGGPGPPPHGVQHGPQRRPHGQARCALLALLAQTAASLNLPA